jgi:hypothetical protein
MSVEAGSPSYSGYDEGRGYGWLMFSGVLLLTVGVFNVIDGIAAISRAHFFVADAHYVTGDLRAWGWTILILGVVLVLVGLGVLARNQLARWAGVLFLGLDAIAQLLMIPAYPFWSLAMFAVCIVAMYGLIAYGQRTPTS